MLRMFISLYLVIMLGIVSINWVSEYVWQQFYGNDNQALTLVKQLANSIAHVPDIQQLTVDTQNNVKITTLDKSDIAWLPEQHAQLSAGNVVSIFDSSERLLLFIQIKNTDQVKKIGPFRHIEADQPSKLPFLVISYALLAVFVALWTRPVWRDLQQLTKLVQHDKLSNPPNSSKKHLSRSAISPVVNTIKQMASRIQQLLNEQKYLINAVSHELRTPLSRLRFALVVLDNLPQQQQQEIEQDIQEIENLIDEMLGYSRIEHLALQQETSQVNIIELIDHQVEKHQRGTQKKIHVEHGLDVLWRCNGDLIERASQNLITNATRYANENVYISIVLEENNLLISIEDDGDGIAKEQWPTLFDPFTRLDKSRSKENGGYGLGLAIVKKACELHNGHCDIEHSSYGGAKFTLVIPNYK